MSLNVKVIVSLTNVRRLYLLPNGQQYKCMPKRKCHENYRWENKALY